MLRSELNTTHLKHAWLWYMYLAGLLIPASFVPYDQHYTIWLAGCSYTIRYDSLPKLFVLGGTPQKIAQAMIWKEVIIHIHSLIRDIDYRLPWQRSAAMLRWGLCRCRSPLGALHGLTSCHNSWRWCHLTTESPIVSHRLWVSPMMGRQWWAADMFWLVFVFAHNLIERSYSWSQTEEWICIISKHRNHEAWRCFGPAKRASNLNVKF